MTFGEQYPEKPPRIRFTSEVFHPNVYSDGTLCMDIIQDQWSPIHNVCTLLTSIQSLLTDPNPASPANPEAGALSSQSIRLEFRLDSVCVYPLSARSPRETPSFISGEPAAYASRMKKRVRAPAPAPACACVCVCTGTRVCV